MKKIVAFVSLLVLAGCAAVPVKDPAKMATGYYDRGISYLQQRQYEQAIVEFQRSVATDPKFKQAHYALCVVYDMIGKSVEAEQYCKEALDIDSDFSEAHNELGVLYFKQRKWKEALKEFQRALDNKLYSTPHVPYLNMGDMFMAQKEYDKAINAYRESKRLVNQDVTVYKLGMALVAAGNTHEAIGELQEGVALSPQNADMRLALGLAYLKDGNKQAALQEFKRVTQLAPKSDAARTAQDYVTTLSNGTSRPSKGRR